MKLGAAAYMTIMENGYMKSEAATAFMIYMGTGNMKSGATVYMTHPGIG
jgi:hypothetical protein